MKRCLICGCHEQSACQHPEAGPCSWATKNVCSHCADPELFTATEWPIENYKDHAITPESLVKAFGELDIWIVVKPRMIYNDKIKFEVMVILIDQLKVRKFEKLMEAWFVKPLKISDGFYNIDLDATRQAQDAEMYMDDDWDDED